MGKKIVVVGGGIAGLTAAYTLLKQGRAAARPFEVTLLEADAAAGGQARTFHVRPVAPGGAAIPGEAPFTVEHGSHVFFGFYDTILRIVAELRADPRLAAGMPALAAVPAWTIGDAYGDIATLEQGPVLCAPYSVLPSMLAVPWLPLVERVRLGIGALSVLRHSYADLPALDRMTARELALASGYGKLGATAWNSASLGLTNLFLQELSGAVFWAKHKVLLAYPDGLSYQLPAGDLSELIAAPMKKKLQALGATLTLNATAETLSRPEGHARTIVTYAAPDGPRTIEADHVLLAVAPSAAARLVPWVKAPWTELRKVTPVVTVVMRLSAKLLPRRGSPGAHEIGVSREQWSFSVATDLSAYWPEYAGLGKTVIRCEVGHADLLPGWPEITDDALVATIHNDLGRLFPEIADRGIAVEAYAVHRETERLYTRWARGQWSKKPTQRDVGQGVFLAGDWTTKGTIGMEAAANSGIEAANHVLVQEGMAPVRFRDVPL
jgi:uncharacterized protein with NAD-binding domain and iron-sulfur cluster